VSTKMIFSAFVVLLIGLSRSLSGQIAINPLPVHANEWGSILSADKCRFVEGFETADFSKMPWQHSGDASWVVTSQRYFLGAYSAQAGAIDNDESTTLRVTLECVSGNISFYRKVSSESGYDYLKFYVDGLEEGNWSGQEDWAQTSLPVEAGIRTFQWTYLKDSSASADDDTARIDDIVFPVDCDIEPGPPTSAQQGFFMNVWRPKTVEAPEYVEAEKPSGDPTVTVTIDAADALTRISPYIFGHNVNTFFGVYYDKPELLTDICNIRPAVLRYPGGSGSDSFFWDRSQSDGIPDDAHTEKFKAGRSDDPSYLSLDNFYELRDKTGADAINVINYGYARYGTGPDPVANAARYAAEWVRHDQGSTRFWEIGNENYGAWEEGYEIDTSKNQDGQPQIISGELYGRHFWVFADAMRAAAAEIGHDIKIGAVGYGSSDSWSSVQNGWNEGVIKEAGDVADFISVHKYFGYWEDWDAATILNKASEIHGPRQAILDTFAKVGKDPLPVVMTEWNIRNEGRFQNVACVNGLHAVLGLRGLIQSGHQLACRWNLVWRFLNGKTHGMIGTDRDYVAEGMEPWSPRAPFFYWYYFQKWCGDVAVKSTVDGSQDIVVFGSTYSSGEMGVVVVNKGATNELLDIRLENFAPGDRYYWYTLLGDSRQGPLSRKVEINGRGTSYDAGGPEDYESSQAYSAGIEGGIRIETPAFSAVYILVQHEQIRAWNPNPKNGAEVPLAELTRLSWSPGKNALSHDVYVGIDSEDVTTADITDTTGIYQGTQDANSFELSEALASNTTYYWRIDEFDGDVTHKGNLWMFSAREGTESDPEPEPDITDLVIGDFEDGVGNWALTSEGTSTIALSDIGVTSGSQSLALTAPKNAFSWAVMHRGVVDLANYHTLSADITWIASEWRPQTGMWVNFKNIAVNSSGVSGWKQYTPTGPAGWNPTNGDHTRTLTWDISDYDATGATWMRIIFSTNMGGVTTAGNFYIDNVKLIKN